VPRGSSSKDQGHGLDLAVINLVVATLGQKKGTPKDIQSLLRHSKLATTTDVYMQEIAESVKNRPIVDSDCF